jgi:hypothetical protein
MGAFYLLGKGLWFKDRVALFISILGIGFLGLSLFGVQYERGGYHLIPFIFLIISAVISDAMSVTTTLVPSPGSLRAVTAILLLAILAQPTWNLIQRYVTEYDEVKLRDQSIFINRSLPRSWIAGHYEQGSRIAGTPWCFIMVLPNVENEGYKRDQQMLGVVYQVSDRLRSQHPPSVDDLRNNADVLVISDWDEAFILSTFKHYGFVDRYQEWSNFFRDLPKHFDGIRFTSQTFVHGIREVSVFSIREAPHHLNDQVSGENYGSAVTIIGGLRLR